VNKRRIIDLISLSLIVILFFVSFEVIKQNKELKQELDQEYFQFIRDTEYALRSMEDINSDEITNNDYASQYLYDQIRQIEDASVTFMLLDNDLKKLGSILSDISYYQRMLFNQEELLEAEIAANKERVRTLAFLFQDISLAGDDQTDWYDALHGKDSPFIPLMETRLKYIE